MHGAYPSPPPPSTEFTRPAPRGQSPFVGPHPLVGSTSHVGSWIPDPGKRASALRSQLSRPALRGLRRSTPGRCLRVQRPVPALWPRTAGAGGARRDARSLRAAGRTRAPRAARQATRRPVVDAARCGRVRRRAHLRDPGRLLLVGGDVGRRNREYRHGPAPPVRKQVLAHWTLPVQRPARARPERGDPGHLGSTTLGPRPGRRRVTHPGVRCLRTPRRVV